MKTDIIAHASALSILIPLTIYLVNFRKWVVIEHIVGVLLICSALSDGLSLILFLNQRPNAIVVNSYFVLVFILLSYFYYKVIFNLKLKAVWILGVIIYTCLFLSNAFFGSGFSEFQNMMWAWTGIIMITFSIIYFVTELSSLPDSRLFGNFSTWINISVLFYFSFNLILFVTADYIFDTQDASVSLIAWRFHNANNIIKNILFGIAFWTSNAKAKS